MIKDFIVSKWVCKTEKNEQRGKDGEKEWLKERERGRTERGKREKCYTERNIKIGHSKKGGSRQQK
jgi:hypothetical protein